LPITGKTASNSCKAALGFDTFAALRFKQNKNLFFLKRITHSYLFLAAMLYALIGVTQEPLRAERLSHGLRNLYRTVVKPDSVDLLLSLKIGTDFKSIGNAKLLRTYKRSNTVLCRIKTDSIQAIIANTNILFADLLRKPKEELTAGGLDLSLNKINLAHHLFPDIDGKEINASLKEQSFDTNDIDLNGRYFNTGLAAPNQTSHASIMATMLAGGGNTSPFAKGAAPGVYLSASDFVTLLPDDDAIYEQYEISVQNHSYGTAIENYYGVDAMAYDESIYNHPSLVHVFSSGNEGASASADGKYNGLQGFANLTGSFKMAKNIITVGATDSFNIVMPLSSRGPAYDGRVKPDLVAFGHDGSSGSAALVSGSAALLQHSYVEKHNRLPSAALTKAVLLNSADKIDGKPLSYASGYGSLNAANALKSIRNQHFFEDVIKRNQAKSFSIQVPSNTKQLKVILVWTDTPAAANATKALINDLDGVLEHPSTDSSWLPWVLSPNADLISLKAEAIRAIDTLNNVEQITVDNPLAGEYVLRVSGNKIRSAEQHVAVAYQMDSVGHFAWTYPTNSAAVESARQQVIRWETNIEANAVLEYSLDSGEWTNLGTVWSSDFFFRWNLPDTSAVARLRITIPSLNLVKVSDEFVISRPVSLNVGFDCEDSVMLYWNSMRSISFEVYRLGDKYFEPVSVTTDTFFVFGKNSSPAVHYAVAPKIDSKNGFRSFAINYTIQGTGCYLQTFFAYNENQDAVRLELALGSVYGIESVAFEKLQQNGFANIFTSLNPTNTQFSYTDNTLIKGVNSYRAAITLSNGNIVYSAVESVYYFPDDPVIIFPNPVRQSQSFRLIAQEPGVYSVIVYDLTGKLIYKGLLDDINQQIQGLRFSKGMYFFKIYTGDGKSFVKKLLVL
jgi:hypothetical protein